MASEPHGSSGAGDSWRPLLASGKLVGSYTPIRIYQDVAREMGKDPGSVLISSEDLRFLRDLVASSSDRSISFLISAVARNIKNRIDPIVARETYKRYLGVDVGEERAVEMLSQLVARWCIEAADTIGIIRIKSL